ncbi:MAG: transposase family protein [Burkholderia sp.]
MAPWGRTQLGWLRKHLAYANGIPCEDTFRRVFSGLSSAALRALLHRMDVGTCVRASRACTSRLTAQNGARQRGP